MNDSPICTTDAARTAGLDVAPSIAELTAMASTIVAARGSEPEPEVDLARAVPLMAAAIEQARRIAVHLENEATRLADEVANLRREHVAVRGLLDHVNQQAAGALTLAREERALRLDPRSFDSPAQRTAARMYNTNTENEAT